MLASVVILVVGLRLDRADLWAPLQYDGDVLLILPMVKSMIERGSHWRTERLGAPGIQELHDFPVVDHLHFYLIWVLGQIFHDPVPAYNLYHILTYPLTVLTAMYVLRHFGLSVPFAGLGGLLYAFQPYHYLRGLSHYFLAAYFVVPLTLMVTLWVCQGRLPFFRQDADGRYRPKIFAWDVAAVVAIGAATASAGAYYAFFACALLVAAGLYAWVALGTWRAMASAAAVTAVVVAAGVVNHAPAIAYQIRNGVNSEPTARTPEEAETYGMKLAHLVLPVTAHHSKTWGALRTAYNSETRPLQNENEWSTLGLIPALGVIVLVALALAPVRRRWPLGPMAFLTLFAVLLGTIGGLGALFNQLVSPQVRCYNRISIYIAFFGVFASCWLLDRFFASRTGWARRVAWPTAIGVAIFGIWDQTDARWFNTTAPNVTADAAARYRADSAYFAQIEDALAGGSVFTLPFYPYPETPWGKDFSHLYDHVRGYLFTRTVRWSNGAMKGREADAWQRSVASAPVPDMLRRIVLRDFDGVFVDTRGYTVAAADQLLAELFTELGPDVPRILHPDQRQIFFDLRPYRDRLRAKLGGDYDIEARREAELVSVLWLKGFYSFEPLGHEDDHRWCGPTGLAIFVNPTDRPRAFRAEMVFRTFYEASADLRIESDFWTDRLPVNQTSQPKTYTFVIPPGRHPVHFKCRQPDSYVLQESRHLTFFVAKFRMEEVPADRVSSKY
ncbi:Integral membrane protein [Fimbriiglobus ruber]|uniref:Integral membrane protein n=2 Tax=Fimbriiglobus ruber TaxID=1908690 RepID=A0A225EF81_9BACT|nr:Integral membrane protein [Fimbriiglobus ruber]